MKRPLDRLHESGLLTLAQRLSRPIDVLVLVPPDLDELYDAARAAVDIYKCRLASAASEEDKTFDATLEQLSAPIDEAGHRRRPCQRLQPDERLEIWHRANQGEKLRILAAEFLVTIGTVSKIKNKGGPQNGLRAAG